MSRVRLGLLLWTAIAAVSAQSIVSVGAASAAPAQQKELNFVFLHGMGATSASMQSLADAIEERAQLDIAAFEQANPGISIKINTLQRSYPNNVSVDAWANNIASAVEKHFAGKRDLILIGHSMGGKAALYGVAHNTTGLGDLSTMVVTINSPVKDLNSYHIVGGGTVANYIRTSRVISDQGVAESLGNYDSSADGLQVGTAKHWLAFTSAEPAPLSPEFSFSGLDPYPQDMDDGLVPISAQYAAGADAVYYGAHGHSDFSDHPDVTAIVADQVLRYIFGGTIATSTPDSGGTFEHHAGFLPFTYRWNDRLGETIGASGTISHTNGSLFGWRTWTDLVGACSPGSLPAAFHVNLTSIPLLTGLGQVGWASPADPTSCGLDIVTRASPKSQVTVKWQVVEHKPLPQGVSRDHYEITVIAGTPVVGITSASWLTDSLTDVRLTARSQAEGPFRWFKAEFKVFYQQPVQRKIIDDIAFQSAVIDP